MNVPTQQFSRAWLSVEDYFALYEDGRLERFGKTELLEGEIIPTNSQFRPHSYAKNLLAYRLQQALEQLDNGLFAMVETTVAMPPHDAPDPDIVVTSEPRGRGAIPLASVALLVEIAHASLKSDVRRKTPIYARHGVPEFWLVDLLNDRIVRHRRPSSDGWGERHETAIGDSIGSATVAGLTVATAGLSF